MPDDHSVEDCLLYLDACLGGGAEYVSKSNSPNLGYHYPNK